MLKSLRLKFLFLLLFVAITGLSATFLLRELMLNDFREYLEGEMLDRVSQLTAALESSYIRYSQWNRESLAKHALWAYMQGFQARVYDEKGNLLMDTENAMNSLSPLARKRIESVSAPRGKEGKFTPYSLFLGGVEIGHVELSFSEPERDILYVRRSNWLLFYSVLALGGISVFLGIFFSRRMARPIKELTLASEAISSGDLKKQVSNAAADGDELARLGLAFNRMAETLLLQESLRRKLTSNIAHELRTPLSAMRGELEGMMDGYLPLNKDSLQSLYAEIGRLRNILEGMEELTQAEASSLTLQKHRIELDGFLKNIIARFSGAYREKRVALEMDCGRGLTVFADPDKLSQVIINLLSNALKATGRGGKVILRASDGPVWTRVEVSDTGHGIRQEDLPFIFERFYRGERGGLGLGLTIVKELVDAHGGKVDVQSSYGGGSVFTLSIPAA